MYVYVCIYVCVHICICVYMCMIQNTCDTQMRDGRSLPDSEGIWEEKYIMVYDLI